MESYLDSLKPTGILSFALQISTPNKSVPKVGFNSAFFSNTLQKISVSDALLMNSIFFPPLVLSSVQMSPHCFHSSPLQKVLILQLPRGGLLSLNVGNADGSFGETAKEASDFKWDIILCLRLPNSDTSAFRISLFSKHHFLDHWLVMGALLGDSGLQALEF